MIVYTANYGDVDFEVPTDHYNLDRLRGRPPIDLSGIEFVYFTDREREIPGWNVVVEKRPEKNDLLRSKWYKMHSHELFPNDVSMWMDANQSLNRRPDKEFVGTNEDTPVTLFRHHRMLLHEYNKVKQKLSSKVEILAQRRAYIADGFDWFESRVYHGCALIRHPDAAVFNEIWWESILKHSTRDQLSLPYAAWKAGSIHYVNEARPTYKAAFHKNNERYYDGKGLQGWTPEHVA